MKKSKRICAALAAMMMGLPGPAMGLELPDEILIEDGEPVLCSTAASAYLTEVLIEEKGLTLGESSLAYPALKEGAAAEELRETVNERILEDGRIRDYTERMSRLISGGKLRVTWQGDVLGPVFSFGISAEGAVETPRNTHAWTGGNIDLRDGHEIGLDEIFTDPEAAREAMEAYLEEEAAPELSAHLLNSSLTPLPELFRITDRGIIWMYEIGQLSTLSDRAGDVLVPWNTVREWIRTESDSIPALAGILAWLGGENPEELTRDNADLIRIAAAAGRFPGIPAALGDGLQALTDEWHLLIDPDIYALGRMFSLEGAAFRGVFLMTDFLSESWENSHVDGIRADIGGMYGLTIGETRQETWRKALGEPDHTVEFDEEQAEAYRTVKGSRDYYEFGENRLQLHADEEGILAQIILTE